MQASSRMEEEHDDRVARTPVVALVSYCSREAKYIAALLRNALEFAEVVVISMGTRLYSGEVEDVAEQWTQVILPSVPVEHAHRVLLEVYEVPEADQIKTREVELHNLARQVGFARASTWMQGRAFWTLLLDGDEVPDGRKVCEWFSATPLNPRTVYKLANYWGFLHPQLIATECEDSIMLAHSTVLTQGALSHPRERDGILLWHWTVEGGQGALSGLRLVRNVTGLDAAPMFWHFSWVRGEGGGSGGVELGSAAPGTPAYAQWTEWIEHTRRAIKAKCDGWGHCGDRDWNAIIDRCMTQIDRNRRWPERDFVHGHNLVWLPRLPRPLGL